MLLIQRKEKRDTMQRLIIIGVIILIIGIVIFTFSLWSAGWDIKRISTKTPLDEKHYSENAEFESIEINDRDMNISVKKSSDDKIHITYFENDNEYYDISTENSVLKFTRNVEYKWYHYIFNIDFFSYEMIIELPENYKCEMNLKTSNSKISINDVSLISLNAKTSNGKIIASRIDCSENADLYNSNGAIDISDISLSGKLSADTSNGHIILENINTTDDIKAHSSNNKITLKNTVCNNIKCITSNGVITANDIFSSENIELETSNNKVSVTNLQFTNECSLTTSNGIITGTMPGKTIDYTITSQTSNGKNSLPEKLNGGDKKLRVKTSNGKIDINFAED